MTRGALVMVRALGGQPLIRRIWQEHDRGILICRVEDYDLWQSEGREPPVAGFPKEDIFVYDEHLFAELEDIYQDHDGNSRLQQEWQHARPYHS